MFFLWRRDHLSTTFLCRGVYSLSSLLTKIKQLPRCGCDHPQSTGSRFFECPIQTRHLQSRSVMSGTDTPRGTCFRRGIGIDKVSPNDADGSGCMFLRMVSSWIAAILSFADIVCIVYSPRVIMMHTCSLILVWIISTSTAQTHVLRLCRR